MPQDDLVRPDLDELSWAPADRQASLSTVYAHAIGLATAAEAWYASKRPSKRLWGRMLRLLAILLAAVAAVLPILAEIYTTDDKPAIAPGWAAVALAGAAALVALDRYFGFSSGWMRFMAAELRITRLRHDFEYAWQIARANAGMPPTEDDVREGLRLARELVLAVDDVISEETGAWVTEFQASLERAEQQLSSDQ